MFLKISYLMQSLTSLKINTYALVKGFSSCLSPRISRRLLELGFLQGEKVKILRKSLLGKAYLVELRFYTLTIRKDIARFILVEDQK